MYFSCSDMRSAWLCQWPIWQRQVLRQTSCRRWKSHGNLNWSVHQTLEATECEIAKKIELISKSSWKAPESYIINNWLPPRQRMRRPKRAQSKARRTILWNSSWKMRSILSQSPKTSNSSLIWSVKTAWTLHMFGRYDKIKILSRYDALSRKLQTQESEGIKSSERAENVEVKSIQNFKNGCVKLFGAFFLRRGSFFEFWEGFCQMLWSRVYR